METILIIEDDAAILRGLVDNCRFAGYNVEAAIDGEEGLEKALDIIPDLILLDIMLPKINGYEICRLIRKEKLEMPIIMLTAKGEESDIVLGLNLGADDYVTKPFSIKELLARIEAFLRRRRSEEPQTVSFGSFSYDFQTKKLFKNSREIELSPKEHKLLEYFLQKPGRALTRDQILNAVWGYNTIAGYRSVDRFVTTLRGKIDCGQDHTSCIQTIREVGYMFAPDNCEK